MNVAISSHRPHEQSATYAENQRRARESWPLAFDKAIYFGPHEESLDLDKTEFVDSEPFPRIRDMALRATHEEGLVAIINSDIVVNKRLREVMETVARTSILAAMSRRYDLASSKLLPEDMGRDIFIVKRAIWMRIANEIPLECRIGHQQWDSWMVGFLRFHCAQRFYNFTAAKCIFHPAHEDRRMPFAAEADRIDHGKYKGYWDGRLEPEIV